MAPAAMAASQPTWNALATVWQLKKAAALRSALSFHTCVTGNQKRVALLRAAGVHTLVITTFKGVAASCSKVYASACPLYLPPTW